jgi:hypothetical protein
MVIQKKMVVLGIIVTLAAAFGIAAPQAQAISYGGTVNITCTNFTAAGTGPSILDRDNTGSGQERGGILVTDGGGKVLYQLQFQNALGTYAGGLANTTLYISAPEFNPITVTEISLAGNGLPQQVEVIGVGECAGLPTRPYQGVPVPANFVQHMLVCDSAVFNQPAGSPVANNIVNAGQTWYMNPVPVAGTDGQDWTEIFVAGPNDGFIPTHCVQ